jgi:hypothetical protein
MGGWLGMALSPDEVKRGEMNLKIILLRSVFESKSAEDICSQ